MDHMGFVDLRRLSWRSRAVTKAARVPKFIMTAGRNFSALPDP